MYKRGYMLLTDNPGIFSNMIAYTLGKPLVKPVKSDYFHTPGWFMYPRMIQMPWENIGRVPTSLLEYCVLMNEFSKRSIVHMLV